MTSLGKDWHRGCLRCGKCKKTLTPGSHAEVKTFPFFWAQDLLSLLNSEKASPIVLIPATVHCLDREDLAEVEQNRTSIESDTTLKNRDSYLLYSRAFFCDWISI